MNILSIWAKWTTFPFIWCLSTAGYDKRDDTASFKDKRKERCKKETQRHATIPRRDLCDVTTSVGVANIAVPGPGRGLLVRWNEKGRDTVIGIIICVHIDDLLSSWYENWSTTIPSNKLYRLDSPHKLMALSFTDRIILVVNYLLTCFHDFFVYHLGATDILCKG